MSVTVKPVILSGGSGTRLWPLSRQLYPKQLLPLVGEQTLLQDTITRLDNFPNISDTVTVICNDAHRFLVAEQLREIDVKADALLLEPVGRNTAPALTLAAIANRELGNDDVLLVMPADHVIRDTESFKNALSEGTLLAEQDYLVTFGIVPDRPETGYGYIEQGKEIDKGKSFAINRFVEKPELEAAQEYLESGNFLWNSGKFMVKTSVWLAQIGLYAPKILEMCEQAYKQGKSEMDFYRIDKDTFEQCPSDSIDYAVAEKIIASNAKNKIKAAVIPLDAGWSDIGAWAELWKIGNKDEAGNVIQGDVVSIESENSMLFSQQRLIAAVGLKDTVVIETADAILVADRNKVRT